MATECEWRFSSKVVTLIANGVITPRAKVPKSNIFFIVASVYRAENVSNFAQKMLSK